VESVEPKVKSGVSQGVGTALALRHTMPLQTLWNNRASARPPHLLRIRTVILYEYPFNEGIRTMLRLEHLFDRLGQLIARDAPVDHHYALATLFEILDVSARADLKSDLLKDLDKHRQQFNSYRGHQSISEQALDTAIAKIDHAFNGLNDTQGKAGAALSNNEWLMSIRSRISIPGGTCEFDLPAYYAWQKFEPQRRRANLLQWVDTLMPLAEALQVLLGLLRDSGKPHMVFAAGGQFQQSLPQGRVYELMRVRLDTPEDIVPEISGHRLMVSVRLMRQDAEGRLKPSQIDADFELTLCS
jgi:cell division protein ZapD